MKFISREIRKGKKVFDAASQYNWGISSKTSLSLKQITKIIIMEVTPTTIGTTTHKPITLHPISHECSANYVIV